MHSVTVNLQVDSRYGNQRFLQGDNQVSWCNFAATCAVWNTCQESVWASPPECGSFLFLVLYQGSGPVLLSVMISLGCSLLKLDARGLPGNGIGKGDLFFRAVAD